MSYVTVGTCSLCGGDVVVPQVWYGTFPPKPHCPNCGATKKNDGPVIQMERPSKQQEPKR